jgi:hypothetical protein
VKQFFCDWLLSCAVAAAPVTPVADLHYGTVLYAYYQDDTAEALLATLIAQERGMIGDDPVRLELAKGSFAFAEGLYRLSDETFAALDPAVLTPLDRMRLSFHLAREHFRREDWARVETLLADIDLGTTWLGRERVHPEVEFMRAELATRRGDFAAARQAIDRIDRKSSHFAYSLFNLGVAERASGDVASAAVTFTELAAIDAYTEEAFDLKQRALVALSIVRRAQHAATDADAILGAMPSESRYRDLALTSYGGLAMDQGDWGLAARVWLTLSEGDVWTQSSAAARLALPMSLEQMASGQQALLQYRVTEARYEERLGRLRTLVERADDPAWVGGLLEVFAMPERAAEAEVAARREALVDEWRATFGHTDWLEWLATEDVHELLLEWRELKDIAAWLGALPVELETFDALTQERRRRDREAQARLADDGLMERRAELTERLAMLDADIARVSAATPERTAEWMHPLADDTQRALLDDLSTKRALVARAMPEAEQAKWLARIDRLEGVVFWQIAEARPEKLRELTKARRELDEVLAAIDDSSERVARAEAEFAAGVQTDFLAFQTRADAITRQVVVALEDRETRLAGQIRAGIRREVAQIEKQLLLTRMAIARATDRLAFAADTAEARR